MSILDKTRNWWNRHQVITPDAMSDGMAIGDGGTWGWVVIPPKATDEVGSGELARLTFAAANAIRQLIPAGSEYHWKIQWAKWSGEDYLTEELRDGMTLGGVDLLEAQADAIDAHQLPRRLVMLGVRFDNKVVPVSEQMLSGVKKVAGTSTATTRGEDAVAEHVMRIRTWHTRMAASVFNARPATAQEMAWALRRDLHRTVDWVPSTPIVDGGQIARLRSARVEPATTHVVIGSDRGDRFLRLFVPTITGFPSEDLELPGGEWLKYLDFLGDPDDVEIAEPAEVSIRGHNLGRGEAVRHLQKALSLAKEQHRTAAEGVAGTAPDMVYEAEQALSGRLTEVKKGGVGMTLDTPVWIIEAPTLEDLDKRADRLIDYYAGMGIEVWAPPNLQDLLWKSTVIGDKRRVTEFEQLRPITTLMGAWFHGGSQIGAASGPYLAQNMGSTPGPFRNRLTDAQLRDKGITTAFTGTTRAGKSTSLGMCLLCELATQPIWAALTDFKGDLGGIAAVAEKYGIPVHWINTSQQASGSMCPFRYEPETAKAASLAVDNLTAMLPTSQAEMPGTEAAIRAAANSVAALPNAADRSTHAIINELASSADLAIRAIGAELLDLGDDPLARSVAGPPDLSAPGLPRGHGLVYFKFEDLRFPQTDSAKWKPGERLSMMLIQAVFNYIMHVSYQVKGIPKVVALTELHLLTGYAFGKDLISRCARMGAALDTNLLLDTQACVDLLDIPGLADQITTFYAFRVNQDEEAIAQARFLGIDPESRFIAQQKAHPAGGCLVRDIDGQVGPIRFDLLTDDLAKAISTRPERLSANTSETDSQEEAVA